MELNDIPMLNILVAGKTGVGKTTLVNCLFSKKLGQAAVGTPTTKGIQKCSLPDFPITVYDVQGFEIGAATDAIMEAIQNKIREEQLKLQEDSIIDAVLYCIAYGGDRIEEAESAFIKQLAAAYEVPLFIVFTQAYSFDRANPEGDPLTIYVKAMELPVYDYFHVVCESKYFPAFHSTIEPFGTDPLMDKLFETLPGNKATALAFAAKAQLKHKHNVAVNWIWGYAAANFVCGAVIPPLFDIAYLMSIEGVMALHITAILYEGNDMQIKDTVAEIISVCAGPLLASVTGTLVFNETIKLLSYAGILFTAGASEVAAALAGGLVAAAITIALGRSYLWIIESMQNGKLSKDKILSKDPETMDMITKKMKAFYKDSREKMEHDERFTREHFNTKPPGSYS